MAKKVEKTRCSNTLTEAGFTSFIKSALRRASGRWKPRTEVLKKARIEKGVYECNSCKQPIPVTRIDEKGKRVKNIEVNHIHPVVDPEKGFTGWDDFISRLFVEEDGLEVLCKTCHDTVTQEQNATAKSRRETLKDNK